MRYKCRDCGLIIENDSFYIQSGVIIEHERTHKKGKK